MPCTIWSTEQRFVGAAGLIAASVCAHPSRRKVLEELDQTFGPSAILEAPKDLDLIAMISINKSPRVGDCNNGQTGDENRYSLFTHGRLPIPDPPSHAAS